MAFLAAFCYPFVMEKIPSQNITRRHAVGFGPRALGAPRGLGTTDSTRQSAARCLYPVAAGDPEGDPRYGFRGIGDPRSSRSGETLRWPAATVQVCGQAAV